MSNLALMLSVSQEESPDLINAILSRDWAAVGGWSLFISLVIVIVWFVPRAFINEKLVSGQAYRRQVDANIKLMAANEALTTQNSQLITANEITKHFFQETVPRRGEVNEWDTSPSERTGSLRQVNPNDQTPKS